MSSTVRGSARALGEAACSGIVSRMNKERVQKKSSSEDRAPKTVTQKENPMTKQPNKAKTSNNSAEVFQRTDPGGGKKGEVTQILIRFPNGERREHSFLSTDKIQAIYRYVDSLGIAGEGNYRLISNFPWKAYGVDQLGMALKDAGLHPKASLFLEVL